MGVLGAVGGLSGIVGVICGGSFLRGIEKRFCSGMGFWTAVGITFCVGYFFLQAGTSMHDTG